MKPLLFKHLRPARIVWHNAHFLFQHAGYLFFKRFHSFFHVSQRGHHLPGVLAPRAAQTGSKQSYSLDEILKADILTRISHPR